MIRISKEEADRMVLSVLSELSKIENKDFAEQSFKIMEDGNDNSIFTGILLNKARPSVFTKEEENLQSTIISVLSSFFKTAIDLKIDLKDEGFSDSLINLFNDKDFKSNSDRFYPSMKLMFATSQFANAFLEYERLEKQYPAVMKLM